jgi:hypothetical protein
MWDSDLRKVALAMSREKKRKEKTENYRFDFSSERPTSLNP